MHYHGGMCKKICRACTEVCESKIRLVGRYMFQTNAIKYFNLQVRFRVRKHFTAPLYVLRLRVYKVCLWGVKNVAGDGIGHILTHLPLMLQKFSLRCYDKSFRFFRVCVCVCCVKNASFSTTVSKCGPILLQESLYF